MNGLKKYTFINALAVIGLVTLGVTGCGTTNAASANTSPSTTASTTATTTTVTPHKKGGHKHASPLHWSLVTTPATVSAGHSFTVQLTVSKTKGTLPQGTMIAYLAPVKKKGTTSPDGTSTQPVTLVSKGNGIYTGTLTAPATPGKYAMRISWTLTKHTVHHRILVNIQ